MTTKLTLTINDAVVHSAKKYAQQEGRSLSDVVESYLKTISKKNVDENEIAPRVKKLIGIIKLPDNFDYKKELAKSLINRYSK